MSAYLAVSHPTKDFENDRMHGWREWYTTPDEFKEKPNSLLVSRPTASPLKASFITVRTNNRKNLMKDLLAPTLINQAPRINNFVIRMFAYIGSFFWDLATLPIRLVTLSSRIQHNAKQAPHPLVEYLKNRKEATEVLKEGILEEGYVGALTYEKFYTKDTAYTTVYDYTLNLIECPEHDDAHQSKLQKHPNDDGMFEPPKQDLTREKKAPKLLI